MSNHTFSEYSGTLKTVNHFDLKNVNDTLISLSNRGRDFWKSPRVTLIRIEVLVVLTAASLFFLAIFGSWRRRSRKFIIQKGVLAAFTLSSPLVTYVLGSMQSSAVKSSMYAVWAISLYILFNCANSITAYSIDDNNQFNRQIYQCFLWYVYAAMIFSTIASPGARGLAMIPATYLAAIAVYKFILRLWACVMAGASWNLNKMVADYMFKEHTKCGSSYDPATMKGYRYLVDWPLESKLNISTSYEAELIRAKESPSQWSFISFLERRRTTVIINIEKVWQCENLSADDKDLCLSFSLFHLLRRRFFGFKCGESSLEKTRDFVFKGLLNDYNRVFKLIEFELDFMYDFFFTKYAAIYYGNKHVPFFSLFMSLSSAVCISATAAVTASGLLRVHSNNPDESVIMSSTTADLVITVTILISIALLEVIQLFHYRKTIWARVTSACQLVGEQAMNTTVNKDTLADPDGSMSKDCHHEVTLGQYSLLDSSRNYPDVSIGLEKRILSSVNIYASAFGNPKALHNKRIDIRLQSVFEPGKSTKLTASVKEAVVQSLECSASGNLMNGQSSLERNGVSHRFIRDFIHDVNPHSGTSCMQKMENQVYVILTWHIATCHCEMKEASAREKLLKDFEIATKLSKYCAYLVVSQPKLLPGHHYDTRCVFEEVAVEAIKFLRWKKKKDKDTRSEVTKPTEPSESKETIFQKGIRLGVVLKGMEEGQRWKLLADFWAEIILYVAPSDNVKEHIECLAKGGEFLTYLWALLTHAGILDRGQRTVDDIENAGDLRFQHVRSYPLTRAKKRTKRKRATSGNNVEPPEISVEDIQGCGNDQIHGPAA